jgi:Bacterial Ig-like domain
MIGDKQNTWLHYARVARTQKRSKFPVQLIALVVLVAVFQASYVEAKTKALVPEFCVPADESTVVYNAVSTITLYFTKAATSANQLPVSIYEEQGTTDLLIFQQNAANSAYFSIDNFGDFVIDMSSVTLQPGKEYYITMLKGTINMGNDENEAILDTSTSETGKKKHYQLYTQVLPTVTSLTPSHNAQNVLPANSLTLVFSTNVAVNSGSAVATIRVDGVVSETVAASNWNVNGATVTIPVSTFQDGSTYTIEIGATALHHAASPNTPWPGITTAQWSFTTIAGGPLVLQTLNPAHNAVDVSTSLSQLVMTFDSVDAVVGTTSSSLVVTRLNDGNVNSIAKESISINSNVVTIPLGSTTGTGKV